MWPGVSHPAVNGSFMSPRPHDRTRVIAGLIVALIIAASGAAVWRWRPLRSHTDAGTAAGSGAAARSPDAKQVAPGAAGAPPASPDIPPPTAEWMTAPANPITVEAPVTASRTTEEEIRRRRNRGADVGPLEVHAVSAT